MTVPLCIGCHKAPVKRASPVEVRNSKRGQRLVGGVLWRWFCSRKCCGLIMGAITQPMTANELRRRRFASRQRVLQRLIAMCKAQMDEHGRVQVRAMVEALYQLERAAYSRGATAAIWRYRRQERRALGRAA